MKRSEQGKHLQDRPFSEVEKERFEETLVRFTTKLNLPFSWIEDPVAQELFYCLRPAVEASQIPGRRRLTTLFAAKASEEKTMPLTNGSSNG
ncbi:hypothetical protein NDN08_002668 [Rhodosorus marinus]|uniref:Uncharacterized protein n=1 Tax=Rhodosorus marinus TaxID=101924 RepID=A0AAV8UYG1_9RHOD|nr:hypothetical protein NDN08_002668 [Rhodosorus marinus]